MANIWFGAYVPVASQTGNWGQLNQWYSDPGDNSKSGYPGTLLGRLPYNTDTVYCAQDVLSNVGYWNGAYPAGSYVTGSFAGNVNNGTINTAATFSGTVNSCNMYNGTYTGAVFDPVINGGTFTGTIQGNVQVGGTATITASVINVFYFRQYGGTWTAPITSWTTPLTSQRIQIEAGTFSPSSVNTGYNFVQLYGGTITYNILNNSNLIYVAIDGGANISALGTSFTFGSPTKAVNFVLDGGSSNNYTVYQDTSPQSPSYPDRPYTYVTIGTGTYTGLINVLKLTANTRDPIVTAQNPITYSPTVTAPLINKTGGTGKGIAASSVPLSYGVSTFTPNVYISGSSDILQSELA